ncbi:two component transcriptional regulator, winged helix family [Crinalium epipsammum PCC 9333]|uniref:Two component transcriptional regulator, winged helix family n=1 Tax=Crinalium epipsammum PCC 9333 TaxID=1173022 RepID=K9VYT6_9CYAN|nr:response regulator transcription factor [Crinalium epipsammum]AFZ12657.1 two component transcriptional regulator, winged helix family [Crinalium epipsammum PCC 9333]
MDILIVEDEPEIARLIQLALEKEGFSSRISRDGITAMDAFLEQQPDLIILDLMLPGLDGLEVCARIRQKPGAKDPYILMLTARGEEIDRVIGLSTGADDYLVKPFSPRELVARVRALLRRSLRQAGQHQVYRTKHFTLDVEQRTAMRHLNINQAETLDLTTLEFNLLTTFISQPNRVWNRTQLIDKLWGNDFFGDERVVDTHVARLRKKIELDPANPTFIKTVVGVGYKFEDAAI